MCAVGGRGYPVEEAEIMLGCEGGERLQVDKSGRRAEDNEISSISFPGYYPSYYMYMGPTYNECRSYRYSSCGVRSRGEEEEREEKGPAPCEV